ncbi:MAG: hypothetical protein GX291_02070 [Tissierellia bacterium]|nr:hypothetical protein [Bacillota bacterium]NLK58041.1 hypothetical protein [Tissierellia bacterium]
MRKFVAVFLLFLCLLPVVADANAAEPPSYVIIVPWADDRLSITLEDSTGREYLGERNEKFSESYYLYYTPNGVTQYELLVKHEGVENRLPLPRYGTYNNIFSLDTDTLTLTQGKMPFRTIFFTVVRAAATLFIEGAILYLFGYRKRISYLLFLLINLITQGILAWYLHVQVLDLSYGFTIGLILTEIIILAIEALFFSMFVKEHRAARGLLFVLVANIASFVAGYMLLRHLPF